MDHSTTIPLKLFCLFLFLLNPFSRATSGIYYLGTCYEVVVQGEEDFDFAKYKAKLRLAFENRQANELQWLLFTRLRNQRHSEIQDLQRALFNFTDHGDHWDPPQGRSLRLEIRWQKIDALLDQMQSIFEQGPRPIFTTLPESAGDGVPYSDSTKVVEISHGGGFWFLQEFLNGTHVGYRIFFASGNMYGLGVSPYDRSRDGYYAMHGVYSLDHPGVLKLKIPLNLLRKAPNGYEAILTAKALSYATDIRLTNLDTGVAYVKTSFEDEGRWDLSNTDEVRRDQARFSARREESIVSLLKKFQLLKEETQAVLIREYTSSARYTSLDHPLTEEDGEAFIREVVWFHRSYWR